MKIRRNLAKCSNRKICKRQGSRALVWDRLLSLRGTRVDRSPIRTAACSCTGFWCQRSTSYHDTGPRCNWLRSGPHNVASTCEPSYRYHPPNFAWQYERRDLSWWLLITELTTIAPMYYSKVQGCPTLIFRLDNCHYVRIISIRSYCAEYIELSSLEQTTYTKLRTGCS